MKKINSIGYGPLILAASAVFCLLIPSLLLILSLLCPLPSILIKISLTIGLIILAGLLLLLAIERRQDRKANRFYSCQRNTRLRTAGGTYECQNCGSRSVGEQDECYPSCGVKFKN